MTQERWTAVDRYLTDLLVSPDPALDAALSAGAEAGLPPHEVSPTVGKLLHLLRLGRALETLPQLAAEARGPFDLIFITPTRRAIRTTSRGYSSSAAAAA